jgi:hypothetical protein
MRKIHWLFLSLTWQLSVFTVSLPNSLFLQQPNDELGLCLTLYHLGSLPSVYYAVQSNCLPAIVVMKFPRMSTYTYKHLSHEEHHPLLVH